MRFNCWDLILLKRGVYTAPFCSISYCVLNKRKNYLSFLGTCWRRKENIVPKIYWKGRFASEIHRNIYGCICYIYKTPRFKRSTNDKWGLNILKRIIFTGLHREHDEGASQDPGCVIPDHDVVGDAVVGDVFRDVICAVHLGDVIVDFKTSGEKLRVADSAKRSRRNQYSESCRSNCADSHLCESLMALLWLSYVDIVNGDLDCWPAL